MKSYNFLRQYLTVAASFIILASVLSIFISLSLITRASATTDIIKPKGLTLSPLRTEVGITPGTSLDGVIRVTNNSTKPMDVTLTAEVFSVIDQQYDYAFTAESNVVKWVTFNHSAVSLAPGKNQDITYTVGVPLSAEPGGRYISLFASTDTGSTSSGVQSRQQVASMLYITVLGDVSRVGHLVSLSSPWLISGSSTWSAVLQNTGTTHYRSRYNLQINGLFLNKAVAGMSGEALILPGTVRLISNNLPAPFWPGLYKEIYMIGLGDTPAVTKIRLVLYMPIWVTILVLVLIATVIYRLFKKRLIKKD
ncbi:MAG TPA: hypothetical protein VMR16_03875 [Candidatus Saccharimonadales bacterium]|nr:hypothetical protein [Candidatus Saccharimonadales bacterium]